MRAGFGPVALVVRPETCAQTKLVQAVGLWRLLPPGTGQRPRPSTLVVLATALRWRRSSLRSATGGDVGMTGVAGVAWSRGCFITASVRRVRGFSHRPRPPRTSSWSSVVAVLVVLVVVFVFIFVAVVVAPRTQSSYVVVLRTRIPRSSYFLVGVFALSSYSAPSSYSASYCVDLADVICAGVIGGVVVVALIRDGQKRRLCHARSDDSERSDLRAWSRQRRPSPGLRRRSAEDGGGDQRQSCDRCGDLIAVHGGLPSSWG